MLKSNEVRKVKLPVTHISGHDQKHTYCNCRSGLAYMTDDPIEADCKSCIALYHRDITKLTGKKNKYPFGGRPKKIKESKGEND